MFESLKLSPQTKKNLKKRFNTVKNRIVALRHRGSAFLTQHTTAVVSGIIIVGLALIILAQFTKSKPVVATPASPAPLKVAAVKYGEVGVNQEAIGTVKNLKAITLVAQTAGPVSSIKVHEGDVIKAGTWLLTQSSAYAAGSAPAVQRQIAGKNAQLAEETLRSTSQIVAKNREIADQNRSNTEELRKISEKSIDDTKGLIATTEQVVQKLESDITAEQNGANNQSVIQGLRQQLITYKSMLNGNRSSLRSIEYSVGTDNAPNKLADASRDLVYASTELQLKSAEMAKEIAALNYQAAKIMEATTRVAAPFASTVEKIYVQEGQYVTPGTPVAKITGNSELLLSISVSGSIAARIDQAKNLTLFLKDGPSETAISLPIAHVSSTPISGQMYEVQALLPSNLAVWAPEESSVRVKLPLYEVSVDQGNAFVPIDAVFITNTGATVLVFQDGKAIQRPIKLGELVGSSIEVIDGIVSGDIIILDRRVIDQQAVEVQIQTLESVSGAELG